MYWLTADTAAKTASVCIAKDDPHFGLLPIAECTQNGTITHSESLLPMIDRALTLSGLTLEDIDVLALPTGPGSFTGVRIGVSAFKGLCFALGDRVPCIPLSTLRCLAQNLIAYGENTVLCPVMDARRQQFYNALFCIKNGKIVRLVPDRVISYADLSAELRKKYGRRRIVLCGDGAELYYTLAQKDEARPVHLAICHPSDLYERAFSAAEAASELYRENPDTGGFTGAALSPTYLRLSQAERERNEKQTANKQ